jgi:hypothetical protein
MASNELPSSWSPSLGVLQLQIPESKEIKGKLHAEKGVTHKCNHFQHSNTAVLSSVPKFI